MVETKSKSEIIQNRLKKMRDEDMIDFTNKNDYAPKLKQIASDENVDYATAYKAMKKTAKSGGILSGEPEKKKKKLTDSKTEFSFSAKKSTGEQNRLAKQRAELSAKKQTMETDLQIQNLILKSDAFEMVKTSNYFTLSMFREIISGLGGKVAEEKKYEAVAGMMAVKEIRSGWQIPNILETAMLIAGVAMLFTIPLIPQIKKFLSEEEEEKEKKSDEPLSSDQSPDLKNGKQETKGAVKDGDKPKTV